MRRRASARAAVPALWWVWLSRLSRGLPASTFAAGLSWTSRNPGARVFAHVLGGALHLSGGCKVDGVDCRSFSDEDLSETYGIVDVGGGLLFPFGRRMSGVAQIDYRRISVEDSGGNSVRFLAGVRVGFE